MICCPYNTEAHTPKTGWATKTQLDGQRGKTNKTKASNFYEKKWEYGQANYSGQTFPGLLQEFLKELIKYIFLKYAVFLYVI